MKKRKERGDTIGRDLPCGHSWRAALLHLKMIKDTAGMTGVHSIIAYATDVNRRAEYAMGEYHLGLIAAFISQLTGHTIESLFLPEGERTKVTAKFTMERLSTREILDLVIREFPQHPELNTAADSLVRIMGQLKQGEGL